MKSPVELRVTPQVAAKLHSVLSSVQLDDPIVAIARHRRGGSTELRLGIGVYERSALPNDAAIVEVDSIKFYIDPSMETVLNGRTLDIIGDEFTIIPD
jgi:hypothetical protein